MTLLTALRRSLDPLYDGYYVEGRPGLFGAMSRVSSAGIPITEEIALKISALNNAFRLLSEGLSTVPLSVFERVDSGRRKAVEDPLYQILHDRANEEMPSCEWRAMGMMYVLGSGDSFSEIERNSRDEIKGLWPLNPERMKVQRGRRGYKNNPAATDLDRLGKWYYYHFGDGREDKEFRFDQILQIPGMGYDGMRGKGIIAYAADALGLAHAMEKFNAMFYRQGTILGGVVETPDELGPEGEANLRRSIQNFHEGLDKAQRILILEQNAKYKEVGVNPEDAQVLGSRSFQIEEIARFTNIPLHKLKSLEHATNNNIEHQGIEFVTDALRPWYVKWEQWMNMRLIGGDGRRYTEFNAEGLRRGDLKSRMESYQIARYGGWMNGDEIREIENMNPAGLTEYWTPVNMLPVGQSADPTKRAATLWSASYRSGVRYQYLLEQAIGRVVSREIAEGRKAAKAGSAPALYAPDGDFDRFVRRVMAPALLSCAETIFDLLREPRAAHIKIRDEAASELVDRFLTRFTREHIAESITDFGAVKSDQAEIIFERWDTARVPAESRKVARAFAREAYDAMMNECGMDEPLVEE